MSIKYIRPFDLTGTQLVFGLQTLTDEANIVVDCNRGNLFQVTLTADRILDLFLNFRPGVYYIYVNQNGAGGHTLDVTAFQPIGGVDPVASLGSAAKDVYTFISDGTTIQLIESQDFS